MGNFCSCCLGSDKKDGAELVNESGASQSPRSANDSYMKSPSSQLTGTVSASGARDETDSSVYRPLTDDDCSLAGERLQRSDSLVANVPESVKALESAAESMPSSVTDRSMSISSSLAAGSVYPLMATQRHTANLNHSKHNKLYDTTSTTSDESAARTRGRATAAGRAHSQQAHANHVTWSSVVQQHASASANSLKPDHKHSNKNENLPPVVGKSSAALSRKEEPDQQQPGPSTSASAQQHPPLPKTGGGRRKKRSNRHKTNNHNQAPSTSNVQGHF